MPSIFTRIIDGGLPGHFVWQDELCVGILTIEPINEGHVLLIPRQEVDHWDDLPADTAAHMMLVGQRIAKALKHLKASTAGFGARLVTLAKALASRPSKGYEAYLERMGLDAPESASERLHQRLLLWGLAETEAP